MNVKEFETHAVEQLLKVAAARNLAQQEIIMRRLVVDSLVYKSPLAKKLQAELREIKYKQEHGA